MNSQLLRRLFRAISDGSLNDLRQVAVAIIEDERSRGHSTLAGQLNSLLTTAPTRADYRQMGSPSRLAEADLSELPTDRRYNQPMATWVEPQRLQHHMILPPDVERRFQRIEKEYSSRERLAKYSLKPRRRILLYGPPGCGKTLGASRLAWNTGLPLMKVRFDSILSSYFGESASNLRTVFESSRMTSGLLLLDECDFIARSRTAGQDVGEAPRIVNTLLQLLDEYEAPGLLVATTNIQDALDKAIFRRFDDAIEVPLPGAEQIEQLLKTTLSALRVCEKIDWTKFVSELSGCSAARAVAVAQNAAKICILDGDGVVRDEHFRKAISEMNIVE